ncbi:MAG: hypothetical protein FWF42_01695 [Streptococcaceae bacterium]|nr:hypothetical protein [Streptococcaceae bacterium]MCL2858382.1 hypothetical protein [Streptococcaceae bacterium]
MIIYHPSKWFNPLSKIIRFFDADYTGKSNSAIHTDFFTPIPTHPVWPGLKDKQKHFPMQYPRLLDILSPDIIVTSLSMKNVKILLENIGEQYTEIFSKEEPNKSAKYIKAYRIDGKLTVINGRNFQGTYFGGMSSEFIKECMDEIRALLQ